MPQSGQLDLKFGTLTYDHVLLLDAQQSQSLLLDVHNGYGDAFKLSDKAYDTNSGDNGGQPDEPVGLDFSKFFSFDESESETQPGDLSASDPAVFSAATSLKAKDPAVCSRRRKSKAPAYRRHPWTREEEERFQ
eukprot:493040-Hanusia_phi.AAC.3